MAISAINNALSSASILGTDNDVSKLSTITGSNSNEEQDFASVLQSAMMNSLNETQALIDEAEKAELEFSMGQADNTNSLMIAQNKASLAVSYTVAVRDRMLEAYKEIMNMQI